MIAHIFAFVGFFLAVLALAQGAAARLRFDLRSRKVAVALAFASFTCVTVPLPGGTSLGSFLYGAGVNLSVPSVAALLSLVWEGFTGRTFLGEHERGALKVWGASLGLVLYPMAMGLGPYDPYEMGWEFSALFVVMWGFSAWLIWKGNHFGVVLALCPLARELGLLESPNLWDYAVDPFYVLASCAALVASGVRAFRSAPQ